MKLNKMIAAALAAVMLIPSVSCGKKNKTNYSSSDSQTSTSSDYAGVQPSTMPVEAALDGPRLSMKNATAAPGEYAEVTMHVENAEGNWNFCGIHVTYPNVLEPMILDADKRTLRYKKGEASEYANASVCKVWLQNMPEELTSNNLGCLFFAEAFDGNTGMDGDIVTFFLKVPDDAKPGTVYPIGFYYMESDRFSNAEDDKSLEKYVFENWKPGTLTIT